LRRGWIEQLLNWSGKTTVEIDKLMMLVVIVKKTWASGENRIQITESARRRDLSVVTQVEDEKLDGVIEGERRGLAQEWIYRRLEWILLENSENDWNNELRELQVGWRGLGDNKQCKHTLYTHKCVASSLFSLSHTTLEAFWGTSYHCPLLSHWGGRGPFALCFWHSCRGVWGLVHHFLIWSHYVQCWSHY